MTAAPTGMLINGAWRQSESTIPVVDPATFGHIADVADATVEDGVDSVTAAHDAFAPWSVTPARQRAEILRRAFEIMSAEVEVCARLIATENGKSWKDALSEAAYAAEFFRWFSEEASRIEGGFRYSPSRDKTIITDHRPIGVAYLITPWNFPAAMATRKIAPALAAGCTCILKPAAETPLTALWIGEVLVRAGLPEGVVNIIVTSRPGPVSTAILSDPRVATLSFTGSTDVGKLLLRQTADRVLRSSMELGGNAPFLVLEGADVNVAVAGAMVAKMRNGGAACTAANRFYVHESLAGAFATRLEQAFAAMRVGPGIDPLTDLGALVSAVERDKVLDLLSVAAGEGADVRETQKAPTGGAFVSPHVVRDVVHGSTMTRTEIFGPVAPIITFEKREEAIRMANDTDFGLISYVFAKDAAEGIAVARQMESGMVAINRGVASDPAAPFGGMKESGLGREGGFAGVHEFLEMQYLAVDL